MPAVSHLRPIEPDDDAALLRLYTDPSVRKHLGGPVSHASAAAKIADLHQPRTGSQDWAICAASAARTFHGLLTLVPHHNGKDMELSYALLPENQGQGNALRAVQQALAYAFASLHLERVIIETQTTNAASVALAHRLGTRCERTLVRFGEEQSLFVAEPSREAKSAA